MSWLSVLKHLGKGAYAARPSSGSDHRRGVRWQWIGLLAVVAALVGLTLAPALDTLRPVREVQVSAALPIRTIEPLVVLTDAPAGRATRIVQAPGWLEPDPYYVAVTALTDGVVRSIHVLEGEPVEMGQVVAELVPDDAELALRRAEAELARARAGLALAEAERAAAHTDWEQPVERQRQVRTATAALAEARAELVRWPAMVRELEADLERWQQEQQRVERAHTDGAATQRELTVAQQEAAARSAELEAMRLREDVLSARIERLEAESEAASRAAELRVEERQALDTAEASVVEARSRVVLAEAVRAEAQLRLDRMTIRSPMGGYVMRRLKSPGDKVMLGMDTEHSAHIVHVYEPTKVQVRVDVPLADASQVVIGQRCEVVVDVLPDETFQGEVTRITHEADLQKNTLQVKVRVLDPSPLLRPEMLTRVRFLPVDGGTPVDGSSAEALSRVRVPETCLDGDRVWVVRHRRGLRGEAADVSIQTIAIENEYATVSADLRPGDLVIHDPSDMRSGQRVRFKTTDRGDT